MTIGPAPPVRLVIVEANEPLLLPMLPGTQPRRPGPNWDPGVYVYQTAPSGPTVTPPILVSNDDWKIDPTMDPLVLISSREFVSFLF